MPYHRYEVGKKAEETDEADATAAKTPAAVAAEAPPPPADAKPPPAVAAEAPPPAVAAAAAEATNNVECIDLTAADAEIQMENASEEDVKDVVAEKVFDWKLAPTTKVPGPIRKKRADFRLRRLLAPKDPLQILGSLGAPFEWGPMDMLSAAPSYTARCLVDGKIYAGVGPTRFIAKSVAAEDAIKAWVVQRCAAQSAKPPQPVEVGRSRDAAQQEEEVPWTNLASLALFKLFNDWKAQGMTLPKELLMEVHDRDPEMETSSGDGCNVKALPPSVPDGQRQGPVNGVGAYRPINRDSSAEITPVDIKPFADGEAGNAINCGIDDAMICDDDAANGGGDAKSALSAGKAAAVAAAGGGQVDGGTKTPADPDQSLEKWKMPAVTKTNKPSAAAIAPKVPTQLLNELYANIVYNVVGETEDKRGSPSNVVHTIEVEIPAHGKKYEGAGRSKKEARRRAAIAALRELNGIYYAE